jgi:hypothetical protein
MSRLWPRGAEVKAILVIARHALEEFTVAEVLGGLPPGTRLVVDVEDDRVSFHVKRSPFEAGERGPAEVEQVGQGPEVAQERVAAVELQPGALGAQESR